MCYGNAKLGEHLTFLGRQECAMRHDGARSEKSVISKRIRVFLATSRKHSVVLPLAFVAMGLHIRSVFLRQFTEPKQNLVSAARNEARRNHRPDALRHARAHPVDLTYEGLRICDCLGGGLVTIVIGIRHRVIHYSFTDKRTLTCVCANSCKLKRRL